MNTEDRPRPSEVELALMVAKPGTRLGVKPAFVLAREVRALRSELNECLAQARLFADAGHAAELRIVELVKQNADLEKRNEYAWSDGFNSATAGLAENEAAELREEISRLRAALETARANECRCWGQGLPPGDV